MICKNRKNKKGFTLIEMMVSIFIFALIMTAIVNIFARQINAYKHSRVAQGDLENAQFALNYISKTLRTASIIGVGTKSGGVTLINRDQGDYEKDFFTSSIDVDGEGLIVYDFSQEACVIFTFRGANHNGYNSPSLWVETQVNVPTSETESCLNANTFDNASSDYREQRLTTGSVAGSFVVAPTRYATHKNSRTTDTMGKATVSMKVEPSVSADIDGVPPIYVQSSVALRDYPSDLSF